MPVYPATTFDPGGPGELVAEDYQYQFRDLLFGHSTSYVVTKVDGLMSQPGVKGGDIDRVNDHGAVPGVLTLGKRVVSFDLSAVGSAGGDIESKMQVLRETFQIPRVRKTREMHAFVFKRPGQAKRLLWCRCTKRDIPSTYEVAHGQADCSIELTATDPRYYSVGAYTQQLILAPGALTDTAVLFNSGDFEDGAFPIIAVQGPWTNPRLQNLDDDGRTIRIDIVLAATHTLLINVGTKTVELDTGSGYLPAFGYVRDDSEWWNILPGSNNLVGTRSAGNTGATGVATIVWQDVYQ